MIMLLFGLSACGNGGGGGGGGGGTPFTTDYRAVSFSGSEVPTADEYESNFLNLDVPGTALSNGTSGTLKYKAIESSSGSTGSGSATLTVDNYGFMNITAAGDDPVFGGITPDGSTMFAIELVQETLVDEWVELLVGVKKASGMTDADGIGDYYCAHIEFDGSDVPVALIDLTLDGSGGFTSVSLGATGTYSVSPDGSLTITPGGLGFSLQGAARQDGEVFVVHLYDELGIGPENGVFICVQDAGGHTTEDLQGNYRFGLMEMNLSASPEATVGELFFDGTVGMQAALLTNTSGLVDEPETGPLSYGVNGGFIEVAGEVPIFITSDADFFLLIAPDPTSGAVFVGTRYTPLGFPSEYFAASLGGDAISNLTGSILSINGMGKSITPDSSGTLGIRSLYDTSSMYLSETSPFMVDSEGFINVPGVGGDPAWGFVNTTAGAFVLATTDQTTDDFVNLVPGVIAGSGLTNTTATLNGIYNCAGIASSAFPDFTLDFTGDGEVSYGGSPIFYGLTDNGLLTLHEGGGFAFGMVNPNANMITFIESALTVCLKRPGSLDFDNLKGTYVYGSFEREDGAIPDLNTALGTAEITNSTDFVGEVTPTALYNSSGMIGSPSADDPAPLFLNTTSNAFELGGAGGIPVWVSDDYNMFVFGDDSGDGFFVFGIRKE